MVNTCEARWDFRYGGHLAGHTFRPLEVGPYLSQGRAWGQAVAAWHSWNGDTIESRLHAHRVLIETFMEDVHHQRERWVMVPNERIALTLEHLGAMLDDYMSTAEKLGGLIRLEHEYLLPIPSKTGKSSSNRWRFQGFIDGFVVDGNGHDWLVEFKLRTQLTPVRIMRRSRQVRFYAWARQRETGRPIAGVIVDERLNQSANPVQIVGGKAKRPSENVSQITTVRLYRDACAALGTEPTDKMLTALGARQWGQRISVPFRPSQLEEAGRELVSAAQKILELDSGRRYPLRNAQKRLCSWCDFDAICDEPTDDLYAKTLYEFTVAKRDRVDDDEEGSNGDEVRALPRAS